MTTSIAKLFFPAFSLILVSCGGGGDTTNSKVETTNPPVFTLHPISHDVKEGKNINLSVSATGKPVYRWERSTDGLVWNEIEYPSYTYYSFAAQPSDNGTFYRVKATNNAGYIYSNTASIAVSLYSQTLQLNVPDVTNQGATVNIDFVKISAGSFKMGFEDGDLVMDSTEPLHNVVINYPFYMSKYLITQAQWKAVMLDNPAHFSSGNYPGTFVDDFTLPVESVSYNDITGSDGFLDKISSSIPGHTFRLPSESEYEYACRAGSTTGWFFSDNSSKLGDYAWYQTNSDGKTHPVGTKQANTYGLYDIVGNVYVWCEDVWGNDYYGAPIDGSSLSIDGSDGRVIRGGCYLSDDEHCKSYCRSFRINTEHSPNIGFRLVVDVR